jgi:hypothetical protein
MKNLTLIYYFIFCCLFLNDNFAQQQSPRISIDSLQKFEQNEAGFITKSGCKIIPTIYYCLSDGRYYFALGDKKNYYYIDTAQVLKYQNIEIGKDQRFSAKKNAGFARRLWLGTVIVGGPIGILICGGGVLFMGYEVLGIGSDNAAIITWFTSGLAVGTTIFYKVLKSAIQNVHEHNAFNKAQHYVCLDAR